MDSDVSENYEDLYDEADAAKHEKLVEKVLRLNKTQHLKKPSRTEPTLQISEFNLVKSITGEKGSVQLTDLTKSLKRRKSRIKIGENVNKVQRQCQTLPKPLEKPQANRIRRGVAYEKTRLQLDRWEATVTANRVSNLSFPLKNDYKLEEKTENFTSMWRVKSELEEELDKHKPKVEEYQIDLEQEKFPLTMKEMLARRKEAAKLRAYQGYKEAKARRQNKIKSKKFHRIQKREKIKQKLKEFEQLQKTNPEEALKKLEEIEKTRIEERFSLRHKSTGKWARNQQFRAKYDKESRQVLAEQLKLSRDLTQKHKANNGDSSDDEEPISPIKQKAVKKIDLSMPVQKKAPIIDEGLIEGSDFDETTPENNELVYLKRILSRESTTCQKDVNIDPNKYVKTKTTNLSTAIPDILTEDNEDEPTQREIISEAFEDDDIIEEFNKEKQDEIDRDKPKDIDLSLPGWGSWGGTNIKVNKRKKRRFTLKAPKVPRKDGTKNALIINEKAGNKIKEHMVSEVPFPFKTVKDFEASMRIPISNTFVPETAYRRLIKPAVRTKMGTIIEPISKDILVNKEN